MRQAVEATNPETAPVKPDADEDDDGTIKFCLTNIIIFLKKKFKLN